MIIDHIGLAVKNYTLSKNFYTELLVSIDILLIMEYQGWAGSDEQPRNKLRGIRKMKYYKNAESCGALNPLVGKKDKPEFWITENDNLSAVTHIAFSADNRQKVRDFYDMAIKMGTKDNGAPGIRTQYHNNYYGACIIDPDGNNIEAVCHNPE